MPQFPHMPCGDNAITTPAIGKKRSETDFHKDSLLGSWSRGTPGLLINHLVLRRVFKIAPVTHGCREGPKGFRRRLGGSWMFSLRWGYEARCHLPVFCSLGPSGEPGPWAAFLLRAQPRFSSHVRSLAVAHLPFPERDVENRNVPFAVAPGSPGPVLSAWPSTLAGDGCGQESHRCDECWHFANPRSSMGLQRSQNGRSNSLKSHPSPTSSCFACFLNCGYFPC